MKKAFLAILILIVCSFSTEAASIYLHARDVLWSGDCATATVTLPFCRQGSGATLETFCASGGVYEACGGAGGGTVDGTGATNKVAYWSDADTLTYDTLFHFDPTGNNIGLGTVVFGTGLTQGIALTHNATNWPSTNILDTVQFYARDQEGSTNAGLFVKSEAGGITSVGNQVIVGNGGILLSNGVAVGGLQLDGAGALIQLSNIAGVSHGITGAGVATSTFFDARPVGNSEGGIILRGVTESNLGMVLSSITTTDPVSTKSTTAEAAIRVEFGKKFIASPEAMAAGVNLIAFTDSFAGGLGNRWILDNDGDTWQTGRLSTLGLDLRGSTSGTFSLTPNAVTTSYTLTMPAAQGGASTVLMNNGSGVLTWNAVGGAGDALVANPLSQFAATTSAQLAGVLNNETGTTLAVFSDAPTFTGIPLFSGGLKITGTPTNALEIVAGSGTALAIKSSSTAGSTFAGAMQVNTLSVAGVSLGGIFDVNAFNDNMTYFRTGTTNARFIYEAAGSMQFFLLNTGTQVWSWGLDAADGSAMKFSSADDSFASVKLKLTTAGAMTVEGPIRGKGQFNMAGTAPTVGGSCGTAPSIVGSDTAGKVTTGTVAPTSCTVTFAATWANAPACSVTNETTANLARAVSTTTTVVLSGTFVASDILSYICVGRG